MGTNEESEEDEKTRSKVRTRRRAVEAETEDEEDIRDWERLVNIGKDWLEIAPSPISSTK